MNALAILGGTFDPFHLGHLHLAARAKATLPGKVRIIPNGNPPHRTPAAPWRERLGMCRIAVEGLDGIEVGEDESPAKVRYTSETLEGIKRRRPEATLLLVVGSDSYRSFHRWHRPEKIMRLAHLLVVPRPSETKDSAAAAPSVKKEFADETTLTADSGEVYLWRCDPPAIDAGGIRAALAAGKDEEISAAMAQLPPAVASYLTARRLYR